MLIYKFQHRNDTIFQQKQETTRLKQEFKDMAQELKVSFQDEPASIEIYQLFDSLDELCREIGD